MATGVVKWFDVKKGFGFIVDEQSRDVFVHYSSIDGEGFRSLSDGELVEYETVEGAKGLHAMKVRRVAEAEGDVAPATTRGEADEAQRVGPPMV